MEHLVTTNGRRSAARLGSFGRRGRLWRRSLAVLLALVALVGCAEAPPPPAVVANRRAQLLAKPHFEGTHPAASLNPFPASVGPVPQLRGQDKRPAEPAAKPNAVAPVTPAGTLVLYDTSGPYGWLGELYAIAARSLASHFGAVATKPVAQYTSGELSKYKAVIYIGSTYDEPLPVTFLDDVLKNTSAQIIWMYDNIWQLANRAPDFVTRFGYNPWIFDTSTIQAVVYKGTDLSRDPLNAGGIMSYSVLNTSKVTVVANARKSNGALIPWAVRSSNLTYLGEIPFAYIGPNDRYLAFCDLLYDALAPTTPTRYRALVRLEDVSPNEDPAEFKAIVDYLYGAKVPFSVALIPVYTDPLGAYNGGAAQTLRWSDRPQMKAAITYALQRGGSLVLHGYTHQYAKKLNPYSGVSADDFEFFLSHIDAADRVLYDGPVTGDSAAWALGRVDSGLAEVASAGWTKPTVFEFPHYAGSPTDARAIRGRFNTVYHRGQYFSGGLGLTADDVSHTIGLYFPYTVTDIYGYKVLPENLGNYEPLAFNNHPPRLAADLVATARANKVIRDGVASFFFHPYYPLAELKAIVQGVRSAGYTFVAASAL